MSPYICATHPILLQEVELAADVQRNLTAAIAALEELEQHRNAGLGPTAVKEGICVQVLPLFEQSAQAVLLSSTLCLPAFLPSLFAGQVPKHLAAGSGYAGAQAALSNEAAPNITSPILVAGTQPSQSVKTSTAKKDKSHKKDKKRKAQA